ncbi:keratin, type II cytoskeletal 1-like [Vitis riparia]|uniref:keratin, type II cytoskeletal 1-like n=1 Tax=Vitis riparia TaxID=96939 RepID=UPI00155A9683|nr:keratin, type II cytoskeletal 1-like [Vitis riparia]
MDRAKLAIKALTSNGKSIGKSLIEGRETIHEDDSATNCRVSRRTSNATQERDVDSRRKGKTPQTISSSSSSDDGGNGGSRQGGGSSGGSRGVGGTGKSTGGDGSTGGGYISQVDPSMSWAQGGENYYATQDIDHGY